MMRKERGFRKRVPARNPGRRMVKGDARSWLLAICAAVAIALPLIYAAVVVPLSPREQAQAGLAMILIGALAGLNRAMRPMIVFLSCFASARYFYWRIGSTLNLSSPLDATLSVILLAAELYGLAILFLGYFQTIEILERTPPAPTRRPTVDIFIPTYNESVEIVRRTVIGAQTIAYENKRVYVLDDGRRHEIAEMTRREGAEYLTRPDNAHAKAGNLNHALTLTSGEFIAIFDADHVPVRSFLERTLGFFNDARVALVQTAQHFLNPDPFERNLNLVGRVAPEQHFFYHVIQPGNDLWNSAFFCGSCAVLRRSALLEIGGIRTETVTEDAHTALELHARGWRSVYLNEALAAGLATESFGAHVKQRIRWARGMAQVLRVDCPLLKKGLTGPQRLNYFNAMLHFFFGIPRLILIVAPLFFLLLGAQPIRADALAVIAYILPHIGLSSIANSMIGKQYRHSFFGAVYELSIAPFVAGVTLLALVNPRLGKFNVTDKGDRRDESRLDLANSRAVAALLALTLAGLAIGFPLRLFWFSSHGGDPSQLDSIVMNSLWALGNLFLLIASFCVAIEQAQQREAPRLKRSFRCELAWGDELVCGETADLSEKGVRVLLPSPRPLPKTLRIHIATDFGAECSIEAQPIRCGWAADGRVEAAFRWGTMDERQLRSLVQVMFSGEKSWQEQPYPDDHLLVSCWHLVTTFWRATRPRRKSQDVAPTVPLGFVARLGELECTCIQISGDDAVLELANHRTPENAGRLAIPALKVAPGGFSIAGLTEVSARRVRARFDWADEQARYMFWQALYANFPVAAKPSVGIRPTIERMLAELR
jgi:cellulose synthase (UDP-forming)